MGAPEWYKCQDETIGVRGVFCTWMCVIINNYSNFLCYSMFKKANQWSTYKETASFIAFSLISSTWSKFEGEIGKKEKI